MQDCTKKFQNNIGFGNHGTRFKGMSRSDSEISVGTTVQNKSGDTELGYRLI